MVSVIYSRDTKKENWYFKVYDVTVNISMQYLANN